MEGNTFLTPKFMTLVLFYILRYTFFQFSFISIISRFSALHSMKSILFQYLLITIVTIILLNLRVHFQVLALKFFSISPPYPIHSLALSLPPFSLLRDRPFLWGSVLLSP